MPVPGQFDKLQHALAYAFLAVWFTGIFPRAQFWKVALGLVCLGLALEFLQHVMQFGRYGDPWDVLANAVGVGAGVALGAWRTGGWALKVEQWLSRS
jgi:VanZ family protein